MPPGSSTRRTATSWRPTLEAEDLLERSDLDGLDADDAIPDLEDMAYWDGVRCGVVSVLESDAELHLPSGRSVAVSRRIAPVWLADGTPLFLVQVRDRSARAPHRGRARDRAGRVARHARGDGRRHPRHRPERPHPRVQPPLRAHVVAARRRAARGRRPRRARVGAHERDGCRRLRPPAGGRLRAHAVRGGRRDRAGQWRGHRAPCAAAVEPRPARSAACSRSARPTRTARARRASRATAASTSSRTCPTAPASWPTLEDALRSSRAERRLRRAVHRVQPRRPVRRGRRQRRRRAATVRAGRPCSRRDAPAPLLRAPGRQPIRRDDRLRQRGRRRGRGAPADRIAGARRRRAGGHRHRHVIRASGCRPTRSCATSRSRCTARTQANRSSFAVHKFGFDVVAAQARPRRGRPAARGRGGPVPPGRAAALRHAHRPGRRAGGGTCAGATASSARWPPASSWASPRSVAWSARSTTGCWSMACCSNAAGARPAIRCA